MKLSKKDLLTFLQLILAIDFILTLVLMMLNTSLNLESPCYLCWEGWLALLAALNLLGIAIVAELLK